MSTILDSLEDMQYLTDYFDTDCNFLDDLFDDIKLQDLLEVSFYLGYMFYFNLMA